MAAFRHAIEINLMGTVYMCHALAALIVGLPRKKIVNFAGGGAATLFPYYSAYAASKAAIVRFTENLAVELTDEGFDVNCVAPGFVLTRLHQQTLAAGPEAASAAFYENTKRQIESGGVPVEKAADLTAFLLSSASDGITGKFISAPYDSWHTPELQNRLRQAKDLATLRRIDERFFSNVETR
jgi:3-oxoacyl-[acyl-carrier protein] reductase